MPKLRSRGGSIRKGVKMARCRSCGGRSYRGPVCRMCEDGKTKTGEDLTGLRRDRVLKEFAVWLEQNPDPWERAQAGLVMSVPHDPKTGAWP